MVCDMKYSILNRIVWAIAEAEDTDPEKLEMALQDSVDTDSIARLVDHKSNSWSLQFETPNHVVEVGGNEQIVIDGEIQ